MCIDLLLKDIKSLLDYTNIVIVFKTYFFSQDFFLGAATHQPFPFPSYSTRKIATCNIVDPRLVTVNKKPTGDANQSSCQCVRNDVVIGVSVHS